MPLNPTITPTPPPQIQLPIPLKNLIFIHSLLKEKSRIQPYPFPFSKVSAIHFYSTKNGSFIHLIHPTLPANIHDQLEKKNTIKIKQTSTQKLTAQEVSKHPKYLPSKLSKDSLKIYFDLSTFKLIFLLLTPTHIVVEIKIKEARTTPCPSIKVSAHPSPYILKLNSIKTFLQILTPTILS